VPVYGSWDFYLGKGIVGGRITSGFRQGQEAGQLALSILQGHEAGNLRVIADSPNQYMFDYKYLTQYGIDRALLPKGSIVENLPPAPCERYRVFLIIVNVISFVGVVFVLWKYKRQRDVLKINQCISIQLEQKVKERTVELEKANIELKRLSNKDWLTGLYNRRYFDNTLQNEISRISRIGMTISVLMCDIDYFKNYNDTYGHLAGDDCIRSVANTVQSQCKRTSDVVARYGGEEFGIILPYTESSAAVAIAESIRLGVQQQEIPHTTSLVKEVVTVSIGIASLIPDRHTTPSIIIALADKALYESKHGGRNRVTL
jgi:diguanylate cyclase (GGDEF)-like protein